MNLSAYRTAIRNHLRDTAATIWSNDQADTALRSALDFYSQVTPRRLVGTLTLPAAGREFSTASLTSLLDITALWLPYTAADPEDPPTTRRFFRPTATTVFIVDQAEPSSGEVARVFYLAAHTIDGLDSATATTVPAWHEQNLVLGAAAYATDDRARQLAETENVSGATRQWAILAAQTKMRAFLAWIDTVATPPSGPVEWSLAELERQRFCLPLP